MKLRVRINLSPVRLGTVSLRQLDTEGLFPDICTESEKWFRRRENCFVGAPAMKQFIAMLKEGN